MANEGEKDKSKKEVEKRTAPSGAVFNRPFVSNFEIDPTLFDDLWYLEKVEERRIEAREDSGWSGARLYRDRLGPHSVRDGRR